MFGSTKISSLAASYHRLFSTSWSHYLSTSFLKRPLLIIIRRKKKYLWFRFPTDPIFFCRPYYFFNAIDRATLFSPGGCGLLVQRAKMASVVTLIIEPNCLNSSIGNTHLQLILMSGLYCKSPSKNRQNHEKNI